MAQFDVFKNPVTRHAEVPFVVSLQSTRYDSASTRLVAPLFVPQQGRIAAPWLAPSFVVSGRMLVLNVFGMATLPVARLGQPVWSLADDDSRGRIILALDEFFSQA